MKVPATRGYLLNPESIALTDMVMNLFIFFFVTFSLLYTFSPDRQSHLEVSLPKASTGKGTTERLTVITVTKNGMYYIGGRHVPEKRLPSELGDLAKKHPGIAILIRADEASPCKSLVTAFDSCRAAGLTRTSLAVQPANES